MGKFFNGKVKKDNSLYIKIGCIAGGVLIIIILIALIAAKGNGESSENISISEEIELQINAESIISEDIIVGDYNEEDIVIDDSEVDYSTLGTYKLYVSTKKILEDYDKTLELSSFKESGNIDYCVSVAFGIEPKFITDGDESMTIDDFRESDCRDITIKCVKSRDSGFQKRYITLNAPYCTFEPYDETRPNNSSKSKKRRNVRFVDECFSG